MPQDAGMGQSLRLHLIAHCAQVSYNKAIAVKNRQVASEALGVSVAHQLRSIDSLLKVING